MIPQLLFWYLGKETLYIFSCVSIQHADMGLGDCKTHQRSYKTALCVVHPVFQLLTEVRTPHRRGALYSSPTPGWLWVPLHYAVAEQKYSLCSPFTDTVLLQTDQARCYNKEKWNRMFLLEFIPLLKVLKESMKAILIFNYWF